MVLQDKNKRHQLIIKLEELLCIPCNLQLLSKNELKEFINFKAYIRKGSPFPMSIIPLIP